MASANRFVRFLSVGRASKKASLPGPSSPREKCRGSFLVRIRREGRIRNVSRPGEKANQRRFTHNSRYGQETPDGIMMDYSRDHVHNAIQEGIKEDIRVAFEHKRYRATVILIYAGMDAMGPDGFPGLSEACRLAAENCLILTPEPHTSSR